MRPSRAGPSNAEAANEHEDEALVSPLGSEDGFDSDGDDEIFQSTRISDLPPSLPGIEIGEDGIELPSRFPSKATSKASSRRAQMNDMTDIPLIPDLPIRVPSAKPSVPRKSSRRQSQSVDLTQSSAGFLQAQEPLDLSKQHISQRSLDLPFERTNSSKRQSTISAKSSVGVLGNEGSSQNTSPPSLSAHLQNDRPSSVGYVTHHSIHTVNPLENPEFLGSSAIVVDGQHSGASSIEQQRE